MDNQFAEDVKEGLTAYPKYIPSKYFYDKKGDELFQQIMQLPEYYLTNLEYEIFTGQQHDMLQAISPNGESFNLIEFGAGDATKTKVLLKCFLDKKAEFIYSPVDISGNVLQILENKLSEEFPDLLIKSVEDDYFNAVDVINKRDFDKKVLFFLGGNIGNFSLDESLNFLRTVREKMNPGDLLLTGFDLKKDPRVILNAYNDNSGITHAFNMNLLHRINNELDAEFVPENFYHYPVYDPSSGEARSYLVSRIRQEVPVNSLNIKIVLEAGETIHTEISRKYHIRDIEKLARDTGFEIANHFFDEKKYFVDSLWKVV
ncbi:MAG TPA: L-histidine N(alpha)-methyltransferase [Bacteroidales bacterium]|nr:L-histidine N(alpha)-methyltransferase [Bacteroidales bacterium]